jgi:hypothetical protein
MPSLVNDPQHWRFRAEEARKRAAQMTDPAGKQIMVDIATSYDKLAEEAEKRLMGPADDSD